MEADLLQVDEIAAGGLVHIDQGREKRDCHSHVLSYPSHFVSTAGVETKAREIL